MSQKLAGKVAVVTGGNSGIGLATARRFVAAGAHVFITGRRQSQLDEAVREIGHNVTAVQGDVANLADLDRLYAEVQKRGHLDILFANAGVLENVPLGSITEEHYDKLFDTNVKGLLFTVQKALPLLRDGSSIILTASVAATKGFGSSSVYSATKAAIRSFARCWTTDLKPRNIRINVISPGPIETPMGAQVPDELISAIKHDVPMGRFGKADEVAALALFLGSDDSSYMTGADIAVDGGAGQV